ncbi:HAD family hydrolase [Uliginosibacterium sp. H3]|uniref:HAD family hydrolase n=1 Tax=Uliginosibacterium silvisoli TaxID=3114758 RepID=A0ABU6K762_9RHOO|nr:HAD family hydrolase [Uliginosibacterium sp. H3]
MQYQILATDYDGTLAKDGAVDDATLDALQRLRASGRRLIMVTGRELPDLARVFHHHALFDYIVAENGAVTFCPATDEVRALAAAPPQAFLDRLAEQNVGVSVGHSVVATFEPHEHVVLSAIRDLGMEWHVIFNKGAVMALPANVTKATGLAAALHELEVSPEHVVGVGDAENDHAFVRRCGFSVAVANALPALKANVDLITQGERGAGVTELIDHILANDLRDLAPNPQVHDPLIEA